jgi:GxxExxY protein
MPWVRIGSLGDFVPATGRVAGLLSEQTDRRGYRIDLVVGGLVVVEIKAIERILPVHEAQLSTYLKLLATGSGC